MELPLHCAILQDASTLKLRDLSLLSLPELPQLPALPKLPTTAKSWKLKLPKFSKINKELASASQGASALVSFGRSWSEPRSGSLNEIAKDAFLTEGATQEQRKEIKGMVKDLRKQAVESGVSEEELVAMYRMITEQVTALYQPQMEAFISVVGPEDATLQHYWDDYINQGDDPVGRPNPFTVPSPTAVQRLWNILFRIAWLKAGGHAIVPAKEEQEDLPGQVNSDATSVLPTLSTADEDAIAVLSSILEEMKVASKGILRESKKGKWTMPLSPLSIIFKTLGDTKGDSVAVENAAAVGKRQEGQGRSGDAAKVDDESGTGQVLLHDEFPRLLDRQCQNADGFGCSPLSCSASPYWKASDRSLQGRPFRPSAVQADESSDSSDSSDDGSESPTTAPPSEIDPSEVADSNAFVNDGILIDSL